MTTPQGVSVEQRMGALFSGPQATEEAPEVTEELPAEEAEIEEEIEAAGDDEFAAEDETVEEGEEAPTDFGPSEFPTITGIADGVEFTVDNEDEARRLIQFGKTFTQRNQALIEERKQLEPIRAELSDARTRYMEALPRVQQVLQSAIGPEPTPDQFQDRNEYLWAKDQWNQANAQLQAVQAEQQRVAAEAQQEHQQKYLAWAQAEEERLAVALPEWADKAVRDDEERRIFEYGELRGIPREAMANVRDHRFKLILRDAMRYRELESSGKTQAKKAKAKVKTAQPAASGPQQLRGRSVRKQREKLRKTGRDRDAAPLMARALGLDK